MSATLHQPDPTLWHDAYKRVEDHLLAYRVTNRALLTQLGQRIIEHAAARHELEPHRSPVELAGEEVERLIAEWIDRLIGPSDETPARRFARGRAAIHLANLPELWPSAFLDVRDPPPGLLQDLRSTYLEAGPDLEFSNMVPRPLDYGPISETAGRTWRTFSKLPVLGGVMIWMLFVSMLSTAFYLTRF
ncbi:MAG: hypothetical protein JSS11_09360 [Verrucomicrobia bacterium]|nr:hypothetical protein [Verrucomicrobiota bacterium]